MSPRTQFTAMTLLPLLLLGAECERRPVDPTAVGGAPATGGSFSTGGSTATGGVGPVAGAPSDGGLAVCVAFASASEGVRNVATKTGVSLDSAVADICNSPELRKCYVERRCK